MKFLDNIVYILISNLYRFQLKFGFKRDDPLTIASATFIIIAMYYIIIIQTVQIIYFGYYYQQKMSLNLILTYVLTGIFALLYYLRYIRSKRIIRFLTNKKYAVTKYKILTFVFVINVSSI